MLQFVSNKLQKPLFIKPMRIMNHKTLLHIIIGIILSILSGCQTEDLLNELSLRSSENEKYYHQNNQIAARRLADIMYNSEEGNSYERFKIVHISDTHLSDHSPSNHFLNPINLKQSILFANQQELKINAIAATGDFIANTNKTNALKYLESFIYHFYNENQIPSFICTGNHDCNAIESIPNSFISTRELNQILFGHPKYNSLNQSKNYYYEDIKSPHMGIFRFIALDMLDQPKDEYNTLFYASFSQEQINWLGNVALKEGLTKQHNIIILTHYPFQPYAPDATTYLCDGDFVHSWNMIPEIIEAFRSQSSIKKTYPNKLNKDRNINVEFDFSNATGNFVCYMGGHSHTTAQFTINNLENKNPNLLPQKMLLCTNLAPSEVGKVYNRVERKEDSLSSNSFCIYAIDTKERKIYITYFGAYKPSNQPNYQEYNVIEY